VKIFHSILCFHVFVWIVTCSLQLWDSLCWLHTSICYILWWSCCTNILDHDNTRCCARPFSTYIQRHRSRFTCTIQISTHSCLGIDGLGS
jgi:hypothetical protein